MKKQQALNPYLPLGTYIPDGEPHVFEDRLYVFGSHDQEGGSAFCELPYECWSAPVEDLAAFRCEGTIYRPEQDPDYSEKLCRLYAPDVVRGPDGRYYLYYAMSGKKTFTGPIHVAVCDTPAGNYEYYGAVRTPDGKALDWGITFDPAVFNDDGEIWLYYGWSLGFGRELSRLSKWLLRVGQSLTSRKKQTAASGRRASPMGANAVRLSSDMLTVIGEPQRIVPGQPEAEGTSFAGHAFFEASSMRKIGETYYFIYSSQHQHELCYATSRYPDRDFTYGGVIVSNGDIGLKGRGAKDRVCVTGNNHGSIEKIGNDWYVFYHRHTHKTTYSRQGCAERISFLPDGTIPQTEITSCGLNGGPLRAEGNYPAAICCSLTNGKMPHQTTAPIKKVLPHITHRGEERFIGEISEGTRIGYKYFSFNGRHRFGICYRGTGAGVFSVFVGHSPQAGITVLPAAEWTQAWAEINADGTQSLSLVYHGSGQIELKDIQFELIQAENK